MANDKRKRGSSRSPSNASSETESIIAFDEPPHKKRRHNDSSSTNHNRNSNSDRWSVAKNSDHYRKFSKFTRHLQQSNPYNPTRFDRLLNRRDSDDCDDINGSLLTPSSTTTISKAELMELKEKLWILAQIATSNQSPCYDDVVDVNKSHGVVASRGLGLLKHIIVSKYTKNTMKIVLKDNDDDDVDAISRYQHSIQLFLLKNRNINDHTANALNAWIAVDKLHGKSGRKKRDYHWKRQREVLQLHDGNRPINTMNGGRIRTSSSSDEWVDNMKLVATNSILNMTVIGEYHGLLMTVKEFDDVYNSSSQDSLANLYCFEETINLKDLDSVQVIDDDDDSDQSQDEEHHHQIGKHSDGSMQCKVKREGGKQEKDTDEEDGEEEEVRDVLERTKEEIRNYGNKFIIDAIGYQTRTQTDHLLVYVVPCEHEKDNWINCKFITANVSDWPRIFLVTTRDIKANEPLCAYFGETFKLARYQQNKEKMRRTRIEMKVQDILKMNLFVKV